LSYAIKTLALLFKILNMEYPVLISPDQALRIKMEDNAIIFDATIDKINQSIDNSMLELIPDSHFLDIEKDFSDHLSPLPHTMITDIKFTKEARKLGINNDSVLIIYDRWGIYSSPRTWWMFRFMGFKKVYVLDGGFPAWKAAGLPISSEYAISENTVGNFTAIQQNDWYISKDDLLHALDSPKINITDARSGDRFNGTSAEPREGLRSGHIPGSHNIPFNQVLDGIKFKEKDYLERIFEDKIKKENQNVFTCGSGITASILALAAYHIGYKHISIFDGSWAQWGSDHNLPIAL